MGGVMAKILVADDEFIVADVIRRSCEVAGYEAVAAEDGKQALTLWDESFALLITDFNMPEMTGQQLTEAIRATGDKRPIIQMTANSAISDEEAVAWGATLVIHKPFSPRELIPVIKSLLSS
jgi:CheY-like chemotaxis protein